MSFTDYLEQKVLEHVFRNTAYTAPTTLYLDLLSVAPTDSTSGTELASLYGYARQATAFDAYSSNKQVANTSDETFTASGGAWNTVVAFGVYDASTGGNLLAYGSITPSAQVSDGESFIVEAGKLIIELS